MAKKEKKEHKTDADAKAQVIDEKNEETTEQTKSEETVEKEAKEETKTKAKEEEEAKEEKPKEKTIEDLENELLSLKDKLLRNAAEFENYKRRNENDISNFYKYAGEKFILRLLPVVDDFERSMEHIDKTDDLKAIKKGIGLVYDKMMKLLDEQGVQKIDAEGKPFDFNLHEALLQQPNDEVDPHTVLQEIEKGYLYKDKVLRHSKVIVSADS